MSHTLRFNLQTTLLITLTCLLSSCSKEQSQQRAMPPVEVGVITLKNETVDLNIELPGRTRGYQIAEIRPQVNGIMLKQMFVEGTTVKAGQQLYQIDPAVYQAQYDTASAQLAKTEAEIKSSESLEKRYNDLLKISAVSQQEYIDAVAKSSQAKADVAVARAAKRSAQINLDYTKVFSPIDGRISKSYISKGALLTANQTLPLAQVQSLDPMYVDLTQSSTDYLKLRQRIDSGKLTNMDGEVKVKLILNDINYEYDKTGVIKFSDLTVDKETGNIAIRAVFPNPDYKLLPGLFVRAVISQAKINNAILVPQQAITRDVEGNAIAWTVDQNNRVKTIPIELGDAIKDKWIVNKGLNVGQKVIVEGMVKVKNGASVKPVDMSNKKIELNPAETNRPIKTTLLTSMLKLTSQSLWHPYV